MKVTVSAPGKIHLMGEHAVVYGKPALLTAINRRVRVTLEEVAQETTIHVADPAAIEFIQYALETVKREYRLDSLPFFSITVESDFPFGYHLGSSASLAVSIVGAVIYFTKQLWNPAEINRLAYEVEKKQHGNPSGGDNTAVTFGGFLWFRKELDFLRSIWQLPFRPLPSVSHFFLINTGKPQETTGEMVALVGSFKKEHEEEFEKLLNENERQTRNITAALKEGKEDAVIEALRKGEQTLESMGVVSQKVQPFIRSIEKAGGAAKILGGGGKQGNVGFLLCYHNHPADIETICTQYGYTIEAIELGEEGVRLEVC